MWLRITDNWLAQVLRTLGLMPAALLWCRLPSCLLTWPQVTVKQEVFVRWSDPQSSLGVKKEWSAKSLKEMSAWWRRQQGCELNLFGWFALSKLPSVVYHFKPGHFPHYTPHIPHDCSAWIWPPASFCRCPFIFSAPPLVLPCPKHLDAFFFLLSLFSFLVIWGLRFICKHDTLLTGKMVCSQKLFREMSDDTLPLHQLTVKCRYPTKIRDENPRGTSRPCPASISSICGPLLPSITSWIAVPFFLLFGLMSLSTQKVQKWSEMCESIPHHKVVFPCYRTKSY